MRSFLSAMATLGVAVLIVGLVWPHIALSLLQGLIAALAVGYVGARTYGAQLPSSLSSDRYSPFDGVAAAPRPSQSPPAVRHLATLLQAAADPEDARRAPIPAAASRIIAAETSRRLAESHGLSFRRPGDHARIRSLLSDATWSLVRAERTKRRASAEGGPLPIQRLESVLDEVERL